MVLVVWSSCGPALYSYHEGALHCRVYAHPDMTLDVARMYHSTSDINSVVRFLKTMMTTEASHHLMIQWQDVSFEISLKLVLLNQTTPNKLT